MISYTVIDEYIGAECEYEFYIGGSECNNAFTKAIVENNDEALPGEPNDLHIGHLCDDHIEIVMGLLLGNFSNEATDIGDVVSHEDMRLGYGLYPR